MFYGKILRISHHLLGQSTICMFFNIRILKQCTCSYQVCWNFSIHIRISTHDSRHRCNNIFKLRPFLELSLPLVNVGCATSNESGRQGIEFMIIKSIFFVCDNDDSIKVKMKFLNFCNYILNVLIQRLNVKLSKFDLWKIAILRN